MRVVLAVLVLVLSGCATTAGYMRACDSFLWQPERALVEAWGIPDGSYEADGVKYLKYRSQRTAALTTNNYVPANLQGKPGFPSQTTNVHDLGCETIFVIKDGVVDAYKFEGNDCVSK